MLLLITIVFSFAATIILGKFLIHLSFRIGAVDTADAPRKTHIGNIPFLGGISIIAIWLVLQMILEFQSVFSKEASIDFTSIWCLFPFVLIFLVGLVDDFFDLSPWTRLLLQFVTTLFLSMRILQMKFPFVENLLLDLFLILIFSVWLMAICNATNFIDNHDGVAGTVSFTSLTAISLILIIENDIHLGMSTALLASCTVGFLYWNIYPARMYLGDNGALLLGLAVGFFSITVALESSNIVRSLCSLMLLTYFPTLDITLVVLTRTINRHSIFQAGRDHVAHVLLKKGLTSSKVWKVISTFHLLGVLWGLKMISIPSSVDYLIFLCLALTWIVTLFLLIQGQEHLRSAEFQK